MDARALSVLIERELAENLEPSVAEDVDRLGMKAMVRASRRPPPGELGEEDYPTVWVWSDFHLGYRETIVAGEPRLLMAHRPLRAVPKGCVNVHGHLH